LEFIEKHAVEYDPSTASCLQRFKPIMKFSECTFAKAAKVVGCAEYDESLSIEENVHRSMKAFHHAVLTGQDTRLDGFVFEIKGKQFGDTVDAFGETVRRVLTTVSDLDPGCDHPMDSDILDRRGWRYMWDGFGIFVTCFAPCYDEHNARYTFGVKDATYVLFQPQYSFSFHSLGEDHPWDDTKNTARQKIRQNFKNAGRMYYVPKARFYPNAPMIVPPLKMEEPLLTWYKKPPNSSRVHPEDYNQ